MWWEILPWLAFVLCLGATVGVYQHRHHQQERQLNEQRATQLDDAHSTPAGPTGTHARRDSW
jgi:hypothetical protein